MVNPIWKERLNEPGALPALPEILVKLKRGLYELDVEIDWLCAQLQQDPALVGEILKTINSPLFGLRGIKTLSQAVVLLGLRRVRAIILCQSLRQSLTTYQSPGFAVYNWWDRSLMTAVAGARLCQRSAPELSEEAYLAGLLADVGSLVLARFEPGYRALLARFRDRPGQELFKAEMESDLGIDHVRLAGEVFTMWQLPESVVLSARNHHDPKVMKPDDTAFLPRAIFFAARLTDCVVAPDMKSCKHLAQLATERLFMSESELREFAAACIERYRELAVPLGHGQLADRGVPPALAESA